MSIIYAEFNKILIILNKLSYKRRFILQTTLNLLTIKANLRIPWDIIYIEVTKYKIVKNHLIPTRNKIIEILRYWCKAEAIVKTDTTTYIHYYWSLIIFITNIIFGKSIFL